MSSHDPGPELRAADADREAAAERLRIAAGEGRLDLFELDERLSAAFAARTCAELARLTADVTPPPARPARPVFVRAHSTVNGYAIASLVLSFFLGFGSILAILCGHVALWQIARHGTQTGRVPAIAGLAVGYCGLLMMLMIAFGDSLLH